MESPSLKRVGTLMENSASPPIDISELWRLFRGQVIRTVLWFVVYDCCTQV